MQSIGVISGHSHVPKTYYKAGVTYLNPGSAGPRRFKLPVAVAKLTISDSNIHASLQELSL